jgi:hypothetical protein
LRACAWIDKGARVAAQGNRVNAKGDKARNP